MRDPVQCLRKKSRNRKCKKSRNPRSPAIRAGEVDSRVRTLRLGLVKMKASRVCLLAVFGIMSGAGAVKLPAPAFGRRVAAATFSAAVSAVPLPSSAAAKTLSDAANDPDAIYLVECGRADTECLQRKRELTTARSAGYLNGAVGEFGGLYALWYFWKGPGKQSRE